MEIIANNNCILNNIKVSLVNYQHIPDDLRSIPHWVLWKKDEKKGKIPFQISGIEARSNDSTTWTEYENAVKTFSNGGYDGIGFMLSRDIGIVGIDFDDCSAENGEILPEFEQHIKNINSYTEVSPSGKGIHIFVRGAKPGTKCRSGNIEVYDSGRFLTVTGNVYSKYFKITSNQKGIDELYPLIDKKENSQQILNNVRFEEILTDTEIVSIMQKSKNYEKIKKLINNEMKFGGGKDCDYPSQSEADAALCYYFAFYSKNPLQIDRLFRETKLYRPKWDEMRGTHTYGQTTILNAISRQPNTYSPTYEIDCLTVNGYNMTDLGASYRFGDMYNDDILYCQPMKKWFIWDGSRYKVDDKNQITEYAKKMINKMWLELKNIKDNRVQMDYFKFIKNIENGGRLNTIIDRASSSPNIAIISSDIDPISSKIVLKNGVFDVDSMQLSPFSDNKHYKFTKKMNVEYIPGAKCPKWESHLSLIFENDKELIDAFQIAIGYIFTNENPDQKIFLAHGKGENGKSVTFGVLAKILNDLQCRTNFETFAMKPVTDPRSDIAALAGVRLVVAAEAKDDIRNHNIMKVLDTELLKRISGGEPVRCRFLYGEWIHLQPNFNIWLMLNDLPSLSDTTHAMWRRLVLFPFDKRIPEEMKIPNYDKIMIKEEDAGIFNWIIDGYHKYKKLGKLKITEKMKQCIEEYREDQDDMLKFMNYFKGQNPSINTIKSSELFMKYIDYCNNEHVPLSQRMSNRKMSKEMNNHSYKKKTVKGIEYWILNAEYKQSGISCL